MSIIIYEGKEIGLDVDKLIASGIFKTKKIEPQVEWTATREEIDGHIDEMIACYLKELKDRKD